MQGQFNKYKPIHTTYQISRLKDINHTVIAVHTEKTFSKVQYFFTIKYLVSEGAWLSKGAFYIGLKT